MIGPATRQSSVRLAAAAAAAAGLIYALALFGPGPLDPTNISWIFGDNATYYSGWEQYRHDPHLHFPLAWTERVGYPVGASVAFLDAIPIVAILLRPLSPLLPQPMQYLGLFGALCFVLQGWFGCRLCARFFPDRPAFCGFAGALFVLSAPLIWRVFGHTALLSQWTILAAFDAYFSDPGDRPLRWLARLWLIVAVGVGITPYIGVMCGLCALAGVGRLLVERQVTPGRAVLLAVATVSVLPATGLLVGVVGLRGGRGYWAPGFGLYSLNLNAPVNPMQYGSLLLPALATRGPAQIEGYAYLGLGVLVLLVLNLVRRPAMLRGLFRPRFLPLVALALGCTAFALSPTVTLGASVVHQFVLPEWLESAGASLRASARFFWPAYYLIVLAAIVGTGRAWRPRHGIWVLAAAVALQAADLATLRTQVRATVDQRFPSPLVSPQWEALAGRVDTIVLLPPFECQPGSGVGGAYSYVTFGKLAAALQLRTNDYYAARYSRAERYAHCVDLMRQYLSGALDPRTAYIVADGVRTMWAAARVRSHVCERVDGYNLCTPRDPEDVREPEAPPPAASYAIGDEIDFTTRGGSAPYRVFGWLEPTREGTWTKGPVAVIRLGLARPADPARPLGLRLATGAFLRRGHPRLNVDVVVNGHLIEAWTIRSRIIADRTFHIPGEVASARPGLDIELRVRNPDAPLYYPDAGGQGDFLGLNVRAVTIVPE